jgi:hypothetical protein
MEDDLDGSSVHRRRDPYACRIFAETKQGCRKLQQGFGVPKSFSTELFFGKRFIDSDVFIAMAR